MNSMKPSEIAKLIEAGFDDAIVRVASDEKTHLEALVVADVFDGKRRIARHQMVYKTLGTLVGNEIHELSIRACTQAEYQQQSGES